MRGLLAGLAIAGSLVVVAPAGATTTDTCFDRTAPRRCVALTAESDVQTALVQMGRYSWGGYTLRCAKPGKEFEVVARGVIRRGRSQVVQVSGPGKIDCRLRSTAYAARKWAHVRVTLFT